MRGASIDELSSPPCLLLTSLLKQASAVVVWWICLCACGVDGVVVVGWKTGDVQSTHA